MTNNLTFSTSKRIGLETISVKIRLNDECKKGHEDFAITADIYENGKWVSGGCQHYEILKHFPEFKIFVDLHLNQFNGVPMYAVENGYYFMHNEQKHEVAREHFMCTETEYEILKSVPDMDWLKYQLIELGIVKRWNETANKAIAILEGLTGKKFKSTATKARNVTITDSEIAAVKAKIESGYYSPEQVQIRETAKFEAKKQATVNKLKEEAEKAISKINTELNTKLFLLENGFSIENFIYYNHTNEGVFNWKDYDKKLSTEEFSRLLSLPNLPQVTFKLK